MCQLPEGRPGPLEHHEGCARRCAFDRLPIRPEQAHQLLLLQNALHNSRFLPTQRERNEVGERIARQMNVIGYQIDYGRG